MRVLELNKYFLILIVWVLLVQKLLKSFSPLSFVSYFDELLLLYYFFTFFYILRTYKTSKYFLLISMTLLYMIIISVLYGYNSNIKDILLQSFIHLKFFIFFYIIDRYLTFRDLQKIINILLFITILGFILNFIGAESFSHFFHQEVKYRSSFLRLGGFQISPNLLGLTLGLFYIYFLDKNRDNIKKVLLLTIIFGAMIFLTGSRSALLAIVVGLFFYYFSLGFKYKIVAIPMVIILFISFIFFIVNTDIVSRTLANLSSIFNNVDKSGYIRGIMIYYGGKLSIDHFPIGTGVATFGTLLSQGSIIYSNLGLASKSFFINSSGIYDSNIATILGELGIVGIFIISLLLRSIYSKVVDIKNRWYVRAIFTILIISLITMPIFINSYPSILFSVFLAYYKKEKELYEDFNNK